MKPGDPLLAAWGRTLSAAPHATAVRDAAGGRGKSRRQLDRSAARAAAALEAGAGVRGAIVFFSRPNGFEWMSTFLAILKAGGLAAPVDPGEPLEAQRGIAAQAGGGILLTGQGLERISGRRRPVGIDACVVKLTSGSTGAARALFFTARQMMADSRQICATMRIGPDDLNLGLIPFGHSYGLGNLALPLLCQGTPILCGVDPFPQSIAAAASRFKPTVFPAVPPLLRALVEADIPAGALASLRVVLSAGSRLDPQTAERFSDRFAIAIHNFYGSSETGGITYDGKPLRGVRLIALGRNRFRVEGAAVHGGARVPPDRGRLEADGRLTLLGRAGRMLKIAGRRLDPSEVERALRALPGVRDAHVAARHDRSDTLAAVVAGNARAAELSRSLRERLAGWKVPKKWVIVPEFPTTVRGKPDRRRLAALLSP